ncbi:MAG: HWE histidine kinase domain-containing protein [Pseudomonadota bacterium]
MGGAIAAPPHVGRRTRGIRRALVLLCVGLLLPTWIAVCAMVLRMAETERAHLARHGTDAASRAAAAIEGEFSALRAALLALTATPAQGRIDLAALEVQAATLGNLLGIALQVEARDSAATGRAVTVGRLEVDPVTRQLVLPISAALPGTPPRQLVMRAEAAGFWSEALRRAALPASWPIIVVDAEGQILARLPVSERIGQRITDEHTFLIEGAPQGRRRTIGVSGQEFDMNWQRMGVTGWTVAVAVPAAVSDNAVVATILPWLIGSATLALVLPLGIWLWGSRQIVRPLAALEVQAAALGRDGEVPRPTASGIREIETVAQALRAAAIERSQRVAELASSEAALRRLLDHLPLGVVLVDAPSGRVLYLNARIAAISGTPVNLGRSIGEETTDWPAEDAEGRRIPAADLPLARAVRTGKPAVGDYRLRRADGRLVWLRSLATPMRAAGGDVVTGAVAVILEVGDEYAAVRALGEQVEAEAAARRDAMAAASALAASEERFRQFAEASPDALWIHDPRRAQPVYVGPAAAAMSGLPAERLASDPEAWTNAIFPEDRERLREAMAAAAAGQQAAAEYRLTRADGAVIWIRDIAFPIGGAQRGGTKVGPPRIGRLARNATMRKEAEARHALLIAELNHRVKNTLATVQSIAQQTARNTPGGDAADGFLPAFTSRLRALAQGHDLLTASTWTGAPLEALAASVLAPWRGGDPTRVTLEGPPLWLGPRQALALALGLHELATNAAKHGALSPDSTGLARLTWEVLPAGGAKLLWVESGGPPVVPPTRKGFGSRLLGRGLAGDLGPGAAVKLDYDAAGLRAEITLPPPPATSTGASRDMT